MDNIQPHLALLNQTPILKRYYKDHVPKHFLQVVKRCTTPRNWRFSDFCVMEMTLCSEFFNFDLLQRKGKNASFFVTFGHIGGKGPILGQLSNHCEEIGLNYEKIAPIPRVSIYKLSFQPNVTSKFEYLAPKIVRQI